MELKSQLCLIRYIHMMVIHLNSKRIFAQNHIDNHKNSMASQTVIMELAQGDRVQVYLYTFSGLHDKPGNHLTQFVGVLLKPLISLPESSIKIEKPKKRIVMSLE